LNLFRALSPIQRRSAMTILRIFPQLAADVVKTITGVVLLSTGTPGKAKRK